MFSLVERKLWIASHNFSHLDHCLFRFGKMDSAVKFAICTSAYASLVLLHHKRRLLHPFRVLITYNSIKKPIENQLDYSQNQKQNESNKKMNGSE